MIVGHKDWVVNRWLQRVNSEPEPIRVNLSDAERQDHIPDLLDEIVATHASIRFNGLGSWHKSAIPVTMSHGHSETCLRGYRNINYINNGTARSRRSLSEGPRHPRRTFARNADNDGVSRSVAKDIMGRMSEAIYALDGTIWSARETGVLGCAVYECVVLHF